MNGMNGRAPRSPTASARAPRGVGSTAVRTTLARERDGKRGRRFDARETMRRAGLVVLMLLIAGTPAMSHARRQHGPHVHGEATVRIGIDGQLLVVGLEAPGMSFLGFERAPRDEAERASYERTLDLLGHPERWLALPAPAGCALTGKTVEPHGFGGTPGRGADAHADFDASYQYQCRVPLALRSIDVGLIQEFPDLHEIKVDLVLPDRQGSQVLTAGSTTVVLTK